MLRTALARMWLAVGLGLAVQLTIAAVAWSRVPDELRVHRYRRRGRDTTSWEERGEALLFMPVVLFGLAVLITALVLLFRRNIHKYFVVDRLPVMFLWVAGIWTVLQILTVMDAL
ncbi:hypothetical protein [Kineosporia babensis]|uniref:Uncharacterized protein n=1 Tax=Kineosporia babensis TaxID=499548 RepID=A0A9X1SZ69_9ACTN|nr:hypothetical protein [Kineosporia babensis]MCD5317125.1 hypothetical protein [Kineosporia babensis]